MTKDNQDYPPYWNLLDKFVDKDGRVFHEGKEQPKLRGTLRNYNPPYWDNYYTGNHGFDTPSEFVEFCKL